MKELSLHILDLAQNSLTAGCRRLSLSLREEGELLSLLIEDDGRGMSPELLAAVTDPFTTPRTTRRVGLGLPLLRLAAEQTGGFLTVESEEGVGTTVRAQFRTGHIDCPPLGHMGETVAMLVQGAPQVALTYERRTAKGSFLFDTDELRAELGPDISLADGEIFFWIRDYITEQEELL